MSWGKRLVGITGLMGTGMMALPAIAAVGPEQVEYKIVKAEGKGCPSASDVQIVEASADKVVLDIPKQTFDYQPDGKAKLQKGYCRVALEVSFKGKWKYAIAEMGVHAKAQLADKGAAQLVTAYTLQDNQLTSGKTNFLKDGSMTKPKLVSNQLKSEWSECAGKKGVHVLAGGGFTKDQNAETTKASTLEVTAPLVLNMAWQPCESKS